MNKLIIAENMYQWFIDKNYEGHDPYQLDQKAFGIIRRFPGLKKIRRLLKPFHSLIPSALFNNIKPIFHPKALGLIISGNSMLYNKTGESKYLKSNLKIFEMLLNIRNKNYDFYCWGHPFEWGESPRFKTNEPLICVTAPIGLWLIDFYESSNSTTVLNSILNIKTHVLNENKWHKFDDGSEAVYYSNRSKDLTYNGASMVALFFLRLSKIKDDKLLLKKSEKLLKFIFNGQNNDGSWFYSHLDRLNKTKDYIDNRHTGFILESLSLIYKINNQYLGLKKAIDKGSFFYLNSLCDNFYPKWSIDEIYPIDIHDVAQAIITFDLIKENKKAEKLITFTVKHLSNGKDEFYFKLFRSGKVNKNVFIRWNQAWMFNAICKNINITNE